MRILLPLVVRSPLLHALAIAAPVLASATSAQVPCPGWQSGIHAPGFGFPAPGVAIVAFAPASNGPGALVLGGHQLRGPGIPLPGAPVVTWDGVQAAALGSLSTAARIDALVRWDDGSGAAIYAGGTIVDGAMRNVARWDGVAWHALAGGLDGPVRALAVFDDGSGPALYAGGDFLTSNGTPMQYVARWRNGAWSRVGSGAGDGPDSYVSALEVWDDGSGAALYVGGSFQGIGTGPARRVARWDGASWSAVGLGLGTTTGNVYALEAHDDGSGEKLYAGGSFLTDGAGASMRAFARYDGIAWSRVGATGFSPVSLTCDVRAIRGGDAGEGQRLYVTGQFSAAGGVAASNAASWDGSTWRPLGSGVSGRGLAVHDLGSGGALYVGGTFESAGGVPAHRVARWNGAWSAIQHGEGLTRNVYASAVHDDGSGPALYVGGDVTFGGTTPLRGVARWSGSSWSALGSTGGPAVYVLALCSHDDGSGRALYAGGEFTAIGGAEVPWIARWNGSAWTPVGTPWPSITTRVRALCEFDDGNGVALYAGGSFSSIGGVEASNIARWDGTAWTSVGSGVNGPVYSLAAHDDGSGPALYVGGQFSGAGWVNAARIARWNGSAWSQVGSGVSSVQVDVLHVHDDGLGPKLYLGGGFWSAGVPNTTRLARWTGSAFEAVGTPPEMSTVAALTTFDDGTGRGPELYMGGLISSVGGAPVQNLVRFDGTSWSEFEGGVGSVVDVLQPIDTGAGRVLHVMGTFETVGSSTYATGFASWSGCDETGKTLCFGDGSGAACPCGNASALGDRDGCRSSLGIGGRLRASGTPSLAADGVVLSGSQMPNTFALFFQGTARVAGGAGSAFGDGLRCAGGTTTRLATRATTGGAASYPGAGDVPLAMRGAVTQPGARVYQCWYRNSAAFCTASAFNTTNAVEIVWTF